MVHKNAQTSLNHTLVAMPTPQSGSSSSSSQSQTATDRAEALLSLSIALIDSAIDVLHRNVTTDEQLTRDSLLMPGGTIGKHMRHVIESFRAFLLPLLGDPASPLEINYDSIHPTARRPIARSVSACLHALEEVRDDLVAWGEGVRRTAGAGVAVASESADLAGQMERQVKVVAITPTRQEMGSTIGRELWYISLHAIHHFSMLRTIAVHEHGLELPVEFGTAPSTLLYRGLSWRPPPEDKEVRVAVKSKL